MLFFEKYEEPEKTYFVESLEIEDDDEERDPLLNPINKKTKLTISTAETPHNLSQSGIKGLFDEMDMDDE